MDVLEKYKEAWDNQPENENKVSKKEIYKMMKSKSSSIVKWIFIISILELLLPHLVYLFTDYENYNKIYVDLGIKKIHVFVSIFLYVVALFFIFKFYTNYKNISATSSTKDLMHQILKVRKTVKTYFLVNITLFVLYSVFVSITMLYDTLKTLSGSKVLITIIVFIILLSVSITIFWLIYQLLYGILLKKLNRNYKDLAKLEE
ncbi:hypothetical protein [Tenacibaculum jejuense]|uniref:Uncharacterized protein n=1 Tax=Tenacibaculum jejuense TaxID=584609 RepID=A0A238U8Q1_9FLAO|nr:hypothetical protein [Tenacibaculum jejuense]SNR15561.1 Probable transmembrane protein of unknown function; putative anti ECF-type sigma factor [Tenacibaculum jejuense]